MSNRKTVAAEIASLYRGHVFSKTAAKKHVSKKLHIVEFSDLSKGDKRHFLKAADLCIELGAEPREFVTAQFQGFEEHSQKVGRYMLPMPHQMYSLAAAVRYQRYKGQQEEKSNRKSPVKKALRGHFREERKLSGMVRVTRRSADDILAETPEEFSIEFLKAKGVWPVVRDVYNERMA